MYGSVHLVRRPAHPQLSGGVVADVCGVTAGATHGSDGGGSFTFDDSGRVLTVSRITTEEGGACIGWTRYVRRYGQRLRDGVEDERDGDGT